MSNTEIWLTVRDISEVTGISKQAIQKKVNGGCYVTREENVNGGIANKIALSSLPPEVQLKYYKSQGSNLPAVVENKLEEVVTESIELTEYQMEIADWRTFVVNRYINDVRFLEYGERAAAKEKFMLDYKYDPYFDYARRMLKDFSIKTLERWKETYIKSGKKFESLAPAYNYKGSRNYIGITEEEKAIILKHLLNTNGKYYNEVIRESMEEFKRLGFPYKRSEATYLRFINAWRKRNYGTFLLGRKGEKALNDHNAPSLDRDFDRIDVGDALVIDGHNLNFTVINPATGKAERMIFIMVIDMKSWVPLGWEIMPTENVYSITSALRRAIRNLGFLPRAVYIDNGRANKSKKFMGDKKLSLIHI
jgi:putative transposase